MRERERERERERHPTGDGRIELRKKEQNKDCNGDLEISFHLVFLSRRQKSEFVRDTGGASGVFDPP